jgi:hypothetical protein
VADVALGYETRMRWNDEDRWVWSDAVVQEPLVSVEDFEAAQQIARLSGRGRQTRERVRVRRMYALRGLLVCGLCGRKMQGQFSHGAPYYRCRYPAEYALANHVEHPRNVYLPEYEVLPLLDDWLLRAFAAHRLTDTVRQLHAAQPQERAPAEPVEDGAQALIAACDDKLARYRAIADAGGDPTTIAGWIAETTAQRAAALARRPTPKIATVKPVRLSTSDIEQLVRTFDHVRRTISQADPSSKGEVYQQLRLTLTYHPANSKIRVVAAPDADSCGFMVRVRGGT